MGRGIVWLLLAVLCGMPAACRAAATAAPPPSTSACAQAAAGFAADAGKASSPGVALIGGFTRLPAGGTAQLALAWNGNPAPAAIAYYRAAVRYGGATTWTAPASLCGLGIADGAVPDSFPRRADLAGWQAARLLTLTLPPLAGAPWLWQRGSLLVAGYGQDGTMLVASERDFDFTDRGLCLAATIIAGALIYALVAVAVWRYEKPLRQGGASLPWVRYLDPVVLSSGPNGEGSISRLQVLFFSAIVFAIELFLLLRLDLLSDMSSGVLSLLGISAVGAGASKATDVARNRLDFENWAWLVNHRWLPQNGMISVNVARWGQLVTAADGFDVYHFQMLIFSLVVGVALLQLGFTDLATFSIPNGLLEVLGLSQAVYVGGKLVAQPSCADLNKSVTELRQREADYAAAVSRSVGPAQLRYATAVQANAAAPAEYARYRQQLPVTETMFRSVFRAPQPGAEREPHFT